MPPKIRAAAARAARFGTLWWGPPRLGPALAQALWDSGADAVWSKPMPSFADGTMQREVLRLLQRAAAQGDGVEAPASSR